MIDLKNRSREMKTYQYPRDVSAGPVRPQPVVVHRGKLNPKTGDTEVVAKNITVGGVLTIPPMGTVTIPEVLLQHPGVQRDLAARQLSMKVRKVPSKAASVAPADERPAKSSKPASARKE